MPASRLAARRSALSARALPNSSVCRPASTGAKRSARQQGMPSCVAKTRRRADQESRSRPARPCLIGAMNITIHASFLPHNDPDASLAFYRDILGFEVRDDMRCNGMAWITVSHAASPARRFPGAAGCRPRRHRRRAPHHRRDDGQGHLCRHSHGHRRPRRYVRALQQSTAEIVQEPTDQPYGVRDCAVRDPAGNLIRIQEQP